MGRFAAALAIAIVAISPLPLGSNRDWAWSPLAIAAGVAAIAQGIHFVVGRQALHRSQMMDLAFVAATFFGVVLWTALQTIDIWSELANPVFTHGDAFSADQNAARIAVDVEASNNGIVRLLTYGAVFFVMAMAARDVATAELFCRVIATVAVAVTLVGAAIDLPVGRSLAGTFVNPANYATFAGLACLICVLQLYGKFSSATNHRLDGKVLWRLRLATFGSTGAIWTAALFVLLAGVLLSYSKGAILALIIAAFVSLLTLSLLQRRSLSATLSAISAFFIVVAGALLIAGDRTVLRFMWLLTNADNDRLDLYSATITAISARPLTGWGLGSFSSIYSIIQRPELPLYYDKAHNVFLESAADLGLIAASMFMLSFVLVAYRCVVGMSSRSRDAHLPALGFGATVLVAVHGLVDFGPQIPAVALTYSALLGIAWAQSWSSRLVRR